MPGVFAFVITLSLGKIIKETIPHSKTDILRNHIQKRKEKIRKEKVNKLLNHGVICVLSCSF